jgi:hypothetical protein
VPGGPDHLAPGADVHALVAERRADQLADPWVLAVEQALGPLHQGDLAAEPCQQLPQLDPDRAATDQQGSARHAAELGRLPVGPDLDLVQPLDRRVQRVGPGRQDHVPGLKALAVHLDLPRSHQPPGAAHHHRTLVLVALHLRLVVQVPGHPVAVGGDGWPVQRRRGDPGLPVGLAADLGRAQQRLGGMQAQ